MDRLYIVIRADLKPGLQIAQACHAGMAWCLTYGYVPTNVVALKVPGLADLEVLSDQIRERGIRAFCFHEPDLNGEATAIAISGEAKKLVSNLPLALRPDPKFDEICVPRDV